jgi:hypothetical protein
VVLGGLGLGDDVWTFTIEKLGYRNLERGGLMPSSLWTT